jgi:hypothetical protein
VISRSAAIKEAGVMNIPHVTEYARSRITVKIKPQTPAGAEPFAKDKSCSD